MWDKYPDCEESVQVSYNVAGNRLFRSTQRSVERQPRSDLPHGAGCPSLACGYRVRKVASDAASRRVCPP